ncbi:MAG: hypothetical protein ACKVQW_14430 [Pyrinomonadaceae bacterium]
MSMIFCPECGREVSTEAVACPGCGRPTSAPTPVVERKVIVTPPVRDGFPPWAFIPIGVIGLVLIIVMFVLLRGEDDTGNVNLAVNAASRRTADSPRDTRTTTIPPSGSAPVTVPAQQTTVPGTSAVPPVAPPPDKGTVVIRAKLVNSRGDTQPARAAKFYLLDKDIETILSQARVEPIEGNTLTASLGLAAVFPDRYGEFQRAAMRAIGAHAKYSGTTDGSGAAKVSGIAPDGYYLFAITRVGRGFAMWNSPVSVAAGENTLDLSPQSITEIQTSGE